jgi:methyl-accepting chemotaxis protein
MRLDSIRHRLLAIIVIFLISMTLLVILQIYSVNRLVGIQSHADLLSDLNIELLQLRRHEKDFLLRREISYTEDFVRRAAGFNEQLNELRDIQRQYGVEESLIDSVNQAFERYSNQFARLVALQRVIGLNENSGQQGRFRDAIHELEALLAGNDMDEMSVQLLQLRRHEKDFMLRQEMRYNEAHLETYVSLRRRLNSSNLDFQEPAINLLDDYRNGFADLVSANEEMGLDPDSGLRASFRTAAQTVETRLVEMNAVLTPLIADRQAVVRRSGLVIVVLTALSLSALLLHSFFSLRRAFSTLIMFFYRCKREYELLDERKIDFAEFKILAAVVNEMIQARKESERELKEANRRLAEYENTGHR